MIDASPFRQSDECGAGQGRRVRGQAKQTGEAVQRAGGSRWTALLPSPVSRGLAVRWGAIGPPPFAPLLKSRDSPTGQSSPPFCRGPIASGPSGPEVARL